MDIRRRPPKAPLRATPLPPHSATSKSSSSSAAPRASDALPLPLFLTNGIFFTLFFSVAYFLFHRWREKIHNSVPLHVLTLSEIAALLSLIASFIYLLGFFGIDFVQSVVSKSDGDIDEDRSIHCSQHQSLRSRCGIRDSDILPASRAAPIRDPCPARRRPAAGASDWRLAAAAQRREFCRRSRGWRARTIRRRSCRGCGGATTRATGGW